MIFALSCALPDEFLTEGRLVYSKVENCENII